MSAFVFQKLSPAQELEDEKCLSDQFDHLQGLPDYDAVFLLYREIMHYRSIGITASQIQYFNEQADEIVVRCHLRDALDDDTIEAVKDTIWSIEAARDGRSRRARGFNAPPSPRKRPAAPDGQARGPSESQPAPRPIDPGGGRSHDPGMEARVSSLETDLRTLGDGVADIKATLGAMAMMLTKLSTSTDLAAATGEIKALAGRIEAQGNRLRKMEDAMNDAIRSAIVKAIGPVHPPASIRRWPSR